MKFEVIEREVTSSGALFTKEITLSANAKAFKIIFGQIYPDIIKAIVRELFANGWDSQKMAGNLDTPIDIHLPTMFEPYYSIRDYGLGMSPEIIDEVYSKVFESTKDQSNEEAGQFGMGSKTPLGYTDGFTVTSYLNGILYAYNIFIGSDGNPRISLIAQEETEEPNGVEVTVAVKSEDFDSFKTHAELFALQAGTPVNINRNRFLNRKEILFEGQDWTLYKGDSYGDQVYVRMGCILYKIDENHIINGLNLGWSERTEMFYKLRLPIVLDFDIGDFDVTGSREDIVYNQGAINMIVNRLNEANDEIIITSQLEIDKCNSFAEAWNIVSDLRNMCIIDDATYKKMKYGALRFTKLHTHQRNLLRRYNIMHGRFSQRSDYKVSNFRDELDLHALMNPNTVTYIIVDDRKTNRRQSRVQNLINEVSQYRPILPKAGPRSKSMTYLWIAEENYRAVLRRLATYLPEKYFIVKLEDIIPLAPVKREKKVKKAEDTAYVLRWSGHLANVVGTSQRHKLIERDAYYVMFDRGRNFAEPNKKIVESMRILGVGVDEVFAISQSKTHLIDQYDLVDLVKSAEEAKQSTTYTDDEYYYWALRQLVEDGKLLYHSNLWQLYYDQPELLNIIGYQIDMDKVDRDNFVRHVNKDVEAKFEVVYDQVLDNITQFYERHPILAYIDSYRMSHYTKEIFKILGETKE